MKIEPIISSSTIASRYPKHQRREELERRVLATVTNRASYHKVSFLLPQDFWFPITKKMWEIIVEAGGSYREMLRQDVFLTTMFVHEMDHWNSKEIALMLVEANISRAIVDQLEMIGLESQDEGKTKFFTDTAIQASLQDALKLHNGISRFIEPMATKAEHKKMLDLCQRITNRIEKIKTWPN